MVFTNYKKLNFSGLALHFGTTMPKIRKIMLENNMIYADSSPKGEWIQRATPEFIETEKIGHGIMWLWEREPTLKALQNLGLIPATTEELICTVRNWHGFHNPLSVIYQEFAREAKTTKKTQEIFSRERFLEVEIMGTGHFGKTTPAGKVVVKYLTELKIAYPRNWKIITQREIFKVAIQSITGFLTRQRCSKKTVNEIYSLTNVTPKI